MNTAVYSGVLCLAHKSLKTIFSLGCVLIKRIPDLSKTEREIFDYYVSGLSTKEILESANIKESTLKYHNSHIYEKLNVKSRKELLVYISLMNRSKNGGNDCDTGAKAK